MNRQDDRLADALQRRVEALPRDLEPERDLWSGIAARLAPADRAVVDGTPRARRAPWLPVTVALAAGYTLASVFPLPWLAGGGGVVPDTDSPDLAFVDSFRPALERLPAKTRSVVEADLSGLEHDRLTIEQALAGDPDNALLKELRTSAEAREASVLAQMNRLTRPVPAEDLEI